MGLDWRSSLPIWHVSACFDLTCAEYAGKIDIMIMEKDAIVDFIREKSDRPMRTKELARALGIDQADYRRFREIIKELLDVGELVRLKRNRIGLAAELNIVIGPISVTRGGLGFVAVEGDDEDVMIPSHQLLTAFDGDRVMVRLGGFRGDRRTGAVIKIVERRQRNIVGVIHHGRHFSSVVPDNPRIHRDLYIPRRESLDAEDGEKVVAVLTVWDDPSMSPEGKVTDRLGFPGDPGVDMLTVIKSFDLPEEFPDEVLSEAGIAAAMPSASEVQSRLDLTRDCIYTIDPADAKDFDDAVSVSRTSNGYTLGVHIADVSYFVKPDTALDLEAFKRGNSVYLPGTVIPMLPEALSNDVCSLRPNRRRLAHSVFMDFDSRGKMLKWRVADSVIKSRARLAYEEVQAFFDGEKEIPDRVRRVADNLTLARELARVLTRRRFSEGSLDFDLPESKITLNEKGEVLELSNRVRLEAHRLVEEFMLAANRAVAMEVFRKAQPLLYRVHDKPSLEKMEDFSAMMKRLGYNFPVSPDIRPVLFSRFLDKIKDKPEADFINNLMLRSMTKAVYQRENIGHFGLAFSHYAHFTSPIRRYPDLLVHRLVRKLTHGEFTAEFARKVISVIDNVGTHCSETERLAETAEREAVKVKQVAFMANRVGKEYPGVISGVASFGFFVRLDNLGAEGLVRMSSIDDDYYLFDEKQYRIIGRRAGRSFRLGDTIDVGVLKVDKVQNEIDFYIADKPQKKDTRKPKNGPNGDRKKRNSRRRHKK